MSLGPWILICFFWKINLWTPQNSLPGWVLTADEVQGFGRHSPSFLRSFEQRSFEKRSFDCDHPHPPQWSIFERQASVSSLPGPDPGEREKGVQAWQGGRTGPQRPHRHVALPWPAGIAAEGHPVERGQQVRRPEPDPFCFPFHKEWCTFLFYFICILCIYLFYLSFLFILLFILFIYLYFFEEGQNWF